MKPNIVAATLRSTTTASTLARQVQAEQNVRLWQDVCLLRFSVSVWTRSGLLRGRQGSDCGSQDDGLIRLTVVWPGHLRLVRVSLHKPSEDAWKWLNFFCMLFRYKWSFLIYLFCDDTNTFAQICNRVPELRSNLQKQTVLVWKPGSGGNSGEDRDPAHLAWGKL